jgi:GNAT superfamily N-acetyltransferase
VEDAERIARLSETLGYPVTTAEIIGRLERLAAHRGEDVVLVAEYHDSVIGWIHGAEQESLESGRRCEILGLVVDTGERRTGVGRRLVEAVEKWAAARGLAGLSVRSAVSRLESHPFYERLGYQRVKTQHVYRKELPVVRENE